MEKQLSEITQYALDLINENCQSVNIEGEIYHIYDNTAVTNAMVNKYPNKTYNSLRAFKAHGTMAFQKQKGVTQLLYVDTDENDVNWEVENERRRIVNRRNAEEAKRLGLVRDVRPTAVFEGNFKDEEEETGTVIRKRGYRVPLHNYITPQQRDEKLNKVTEIKPSKRGIIDGEIFDPSRVTAPGGNMPNMDIFDELTWKPEEDDIIYDGIFDKISDEATLRRVNNWNSDHNTGVLRGSNDISIRKEQLKHIPRPIIEKVNYAKASPTKTVEEIVDKFHKDREIVPIKNGTFIVWAKSLLKPVENILKAAGFKLNWSLETVK